MTARHDGRRPDQLRPVTIRPGAAAYAEGSALITMGRTEVLCAATIEERVPPHRRGQGGWVTAEYAMLPRATAERTPRERGGRIDGRTQEIQRLIGRSLRMATDLRALGERTIIVDCDVLQADGGTRTAAVTGGWVAMALAAQRLVEAQLCRRPPVPRAVAAVSVGILGGVPCLDLDYREDHLAGADLNCVMTEDGRFVEVQGTAEREPFDERELMAVLELARSGVAELCATQRAALLPRPGTVG